MRYFRHPISEKLKRMENPDPDAVLRLVWEDGYIPITKRQYEEHKAEAKAKAKE